MIDFQALKAAVSYADAADKLGLKLKQSGNQMRGECPACKSGGDRALVVTEGKGYFCFAAQKGGDVLSLAAHILEVSVKDAAAFLARDRNDNSNNTVTSSGHSEPQKVPEVAKKTAPAAQTPDTDNRLEKVAARLVYEHAEVQALGLSPQTAEELMVGYDKRGIMRGRVLIPLYRDGELAGFMGYAKDLEPILKLPGNLTEASPTNVVRFPKAS